MAEATETPPKEAEQQSPAPGTPEANVTPRASVLPGVIGAVAAISAFAVALIVGLFTGNDALHVIGRGLLCMMVCYPVGFAIGMVMRQVVGSEVKRYAREHPMPDASSDVRSAMASGATTEMEDDEEVLVV